MVLAVSAGFASVSVEATAEATVEALAADDPVIAAAGDIACPPGSAQTANGCRQAETANLVASGNYAAVLPLGDEQYDCGELSAFRDVYESSWGQFNGLAYPIVGDNEYSGSTCSTPGAEGYYTYFGDRASPDQPGCTYACKGYYSYDIGSWHIVALNSECTQPGVGGCAATDPMGTWLQNDLATHPASCTLAYMHRPYWSNGGVTTKYKPLVQQLYDGGVELLLVGHNHFYTRFALQDPNSAADPDGIRQFTVGTGGKSHGSINTVLPNTEVQNAKTFGVLRLTLHPTSYDFAFLPDTSGAFTDSGTGQCHGGSTPATQAPDVTTGSATGVDATSATLTGTVNPQGAATTYQFEYGTTTSYGMATPSSSAGSGSTAQDVSAALTGLASSTTYHYRLVATNTNGTTTGSDGTFTTNASTGTAPGPVSSPKVVSGSTTDKPISVTVRYGAASGAPTGYRISVVDQNTGVETTPVTVGASVLRTKISGLVNGHTYKAKITAFNAAGDGPTETTPTAATAR